MKGFIVIKPTHHDWHEVNTYTLTNGEWWFEQTYLKGGSKNEN